MLLKNLTHRSEGLAYVKGITGACDDINDPHSVTTSPLSTTQNRACGKLESVTLNDIRADFTAATTCHAHTSSVRVGFPRDVVVYLEVVQRTSPPVHQLRFTGDKFVD